MLLSQLKEIGSELHYEEVGKVLQVSDGVVRIYGLLNAEAGELLEFDNGIMAVVMNLEEDNVGAVLLGPTDRIKEGMSVRRTGRIASVNVGESMLGRVVNPLGEPLDGKGRLTGELVKRFAVLNGKKITKKARIEATVLNSLTPMSKAEICKILPDVSPTTVEAVLGAMVREGTVKKIGSARNARYIKN